MSATTVSSFTALNTAIETADNLTSGSDTITISGDITETTDLEAINLHSGVSLVIEGGTINGGNAYQGLFVYQGTVTVENVTLENTRAQGGAGGSGGGGGAGLGGGLFVAGTTAGAGNGGNVTLVNVNFFNESAIGGAGGIFGFDGDGGGGGLGGAGGSGNDAGGGGGIGNAAAGGDIGFGQGQLAGQAGIVEIAAGGAGGAGNTAGRGGGSGGGGGGGSIGGGGGIGARGESGGFGGGGGAAGPAFFGGNGGFGGGGGAGSTIGNGGNAGNGGFGGGGGGAYSQQAASGGFGAGVGGRAYSFYSGGGGGLGAGGDIFVQQGGHLTIEAGTLGAGSIAGGYASGGLDHSGSSFGTAIFLQGANSQTLAPASGATLTIAGSIDDENGSESGYSADQASLIINGPGTVDLTGTGSDFTGGTTLQQGTLIAAAAGALGSGAVSFSGGLAKTLEFSTADAPAGGLSGFSFGDTIELLGFAETSFSESSTAITLTNAASAHETLSLTTANLLVSTNGTNTALQELISTIATTVTQQVNLGNGTYAPSLSVTSTGIINTSDTNGISASATGTVTNAGTVTGAVIGIYLKNGGAVSNSGAHAFIYGSVLGGVDTAAAATVTNTGTIRGTDGVILQVGGSVTNTAAYSVIQGTGFYGVIADNGAATVANNGMIEGTADGVELVDGGSIANSGTITGTGNSGIYLDNGGTVTNNSATALIDGAEAGIQAFTSATVVNAGTIGNATTALYGVFLQGGGAVTDSGAISGTKDAVYAGSRNFTLTVLPGAVFSGAVKAKYDTGNLVLAGAASGSLAIDDFTNFNSISFAAGAAWDLRGGTTQLAGGETISGFTLGDALVVDHVSAASASYANGTGLILSTGQTLHVNSLAGAAFYAGTDGTNTTIQALISTISTTINHGVILNNGIYAPNLSISSTGRIKGLYNGLYDGITASAAASITNAGTIFGQYQGIVLQEGGVVTNTGVQALIYGVGYYGIQAVNAPATIINSGTVGGIQTGILLQKGGAITNSGYGALITGSIRYVVEVQGAAGTLVNSGTISGGDGGVDFADGGTITNSGTIGTPFVAVQNQTGNFTLNVLPGAVFYGSVLDDAGNGVLNLGGATASYLSIYSFSGFAAINFAPGADWTLQGAAAQLAAGATLSGFATGDEIVLENIAAASASYSAGIGLVLSTGETIHITPPAGTSFYTSADGRNSTTTITALINTISTSLGQTVVLNNHTYAPVLTVASTGNIVSQDDGVSASTAATLVNAGTIGSNSYFGQSGVYLAAGGAITNSNTAALIYGLTPGISAGAPVVITNAGSIESFERTGIVLQQGGTIINSGTISGGIGAAIFNTAGALTVTALPGGVFGGSVRDDAGTGDLILAGTTAASLNIDGFIGFDAISFATGADWTLAAASASFAAGATINGFVLNDVLDITDLAPASTSLLRPDSAGTLAIADTNVSGGTLNLIFSGLSSVDSFRLAADGTGGADLELVACFCPGTRIATPDGQVAVEDLRIGDFVTTASAGAQKIKWIGRRRYAAPFCNNSRTLPVRIARHALGKNLPARALYVSPGHALAINGQLVHAGRLVNGVSITQKPRAKLIEYYHIELETHEIIFAENLPVESFMDENFRAQFENAASYAALYPGARAPQAPCLPALRDGFALFALQRRLARRVGIVMPLHTTGPLRGCVDEAGPVRLRGWAQDVAAPEHPVSLIIMAGGTYAGQILANTYRPDLLQAGLGSGHHGFEFLLPPGLAAPITLHRAADGTKLLHPAPHPQAA